MAAMIGNRSGCYCSNDIVTPANVCLLPFLYAHLYWRVVQSLTELTLDQICTVPQRAHTLRHSLMKTRGRRARKRSDNPKPSKGQHNRLLHWCVYEYLKWITSYKKTQQLIIMHLLYSGPACELWKLKPPEARPKPGWNITNAELELM